MSDVLTPDLCVIGAGSGGLSTAAIAASFGVSVVLVERGRMGGDCLNVGCVPSKALIAAGDRAQALRDAARFGIGRVEPAIDFPAVMAHVHGVIAKIAPNDSVERFTAMGVQVIQAEARFTDPRTVEAGAKTIRARRFVLATGSRPAVPPILGLAGVPYLTNDTVFDIKERPRRLLVIGGGPIGVELGQAFRRLGCEVVIVEAGRLLSRDEPETAAVIERALEAEGVDIRVGAVVERVESRPDGAALILAGRDGAPPETLEGSHILVATGRTPTVDGLNLEAAGVRADKSGIAVDAGLRTSNPRVFAIGDCAGGGTGNLRFTHAANHHAGIVIRRALFRLPAKVDTGAMPKVTYTDPELAAVGLTEEETRAKHGAIRILRWPVAENDRAQAERATVGHAKVVATPRGRVLGCSIAAPHAGELIVPWSLAIAKGLKVQDLAGLIFPYPTFSEVSKRAAVEFLRPAAQNAWLRRFIGLARRLG